MVDGVGTIRRIGLFTMLGQYTGFASPLTSASLATNDALRTDRARVLCSLIIIAGADLHALLGGQLIADHQQRCVDII